MAKKTVLIIGSGGREHALGWKIMQSPKVGKVFFAPGNAGTTEIGENVDINAFALDELVNFAVKNKVDLTIVGPDDTLALGIVDAFQKKSLPIFGPTKGAAQLEWSKVFSKTFMQEEGIPTAAYKTFTDAVKAKAYVKKQPLPVVVKASGLALGKGVIIAQSHEEALEAIENIMVKKIFGDAGKEMVIEEFLEGKEVSIHVFCDGENVSVFPTSRDHKRLLDKNQGPNTGGMGTIAPLPNVTAEQLENIKKTIVLPTIKGMKKRGTPFAGLLYPGLMMTKTGPKVLEYNVRFGDPEIQSYVRLLKTDLFDICMACATGKLNEINIEWDKKSACCIVMASGGYPGDYKKGEIINGLEKIKDKNIVVFHAGTRLQDGEAVTNGGRVLGITATGKTLDEALDTAYSVIGIHGVWFEGMQFRKDIGRT